MKTIKHVKTAVFIALILYNYAQTILYMNNKIAFIRLDTLEGKDYTYILRTIIKYLNTKSGQGGE